MKRDGPPSAEIGTATPGPAPRKLWSSRMRERPAGAGPVAKRRICGRVPRLATASSSSCLF
eukprot:7087239-Heterocapsa_arctica.AAC.1